MAELTEIVVGEKTYPVVKTGRALAVQTERLVQWLAKYGAQMAQAIPQEQLNSANGIQVLRDFVVNLSADAYIDLFALVVGCSAEDAEVYFDPAITIETVMAVYNQQPSYKRIISRFFSSSN